MGKKYKPLHSIIKGVPKDFQQIADSAIDHIGEIINRTDIVELGGFILGINYACKLKLDAEQTLIVGLSGMFAVRGLSSNSDIVGIASIATLILLGSTIVGGGNVMAAKTMAKNRVLSTELIKPDTSEERKKEIIEALKRSIQDMNAG